MTDQISNGEEFKVENIANDYDRFQFSVFSEVRYLNEIRSLLDLSSFSHEEIVVDVGCGTGLSTQCILERGAKKVIGVDFSEAMLNQARKRLPYVEFIAGDAMHLSRVIPKADKIVGASFFYFIPQPAHLLREVSRVLAPHGEFLFDLKLKTSEEENPSHHYYRTLSEALAEELHLSVQFPPWIDPHRTYTQSEIANLARTEGFNVHRYAEKPLYTKEDLRRGHHHFLNQALSYFRSFFSDEKIERVIQSAKKKMELLYSDTLEGRLAKVCLKKRDGLV